MKTKKISLLLSICCFLCLCISNCTISKENASTNEAMCLNGIPISDAVDLSSTLVVSYPLQDLMNFYWQDPEKFWAELNNPSAIDYAQINQITIAEAEKRFPIAVIRTSGYTVYKVTEGGCFYVFFVDKDYQSVSSNSDPSRVVASTCYYIPKQNLFSRYFMIKIGDTISKVKQIDPFITVEHTSATRRSFVYLNSQKVLILYLQYNETLEDDYEIIEKRIINRKDSLTRLALILDEDLAW
ncbi:MAG: hypothetical protein IK088_03415 [Lachnospiraceae bacterium]|nr:hypothetical protein [Lachnospiraceae bacterium]